ncbi:MAG: hypothetical protein K2Y08_06550 [Alphaproteobacteria bacterium]|nr:hypothetical protein [Alphaproteobacteria bacterium]
MKKLIFVLIAMNLILSSSLEASSKKTSYFIHNAVPAQIQISQANGESIGTLNADSIHDLQIPASSFPITVTSTMGGLVSPALTYTIQNPGCRMIWWNMDSGSSAKLYSTDLRC